MCMQSPRSKSSLINLYDILSTAILHLSMNGLDSDASYERSFFVAETDHHSYENFYDILYVVFGVDIRFGSSNTDRHTPNHSRQSYQP